MSVPDTRKMHEPLTQSGSVEIQASAAAGLLHVDRASAEEMVFGEAYPSAKFSTIEQCPLGLRVMPPTRACGASLSSGEDYKASQAEFLPIVPHLPMPAAT